MNIKTFLFSLQVFLIVNLYTLMAQVPSSHFEKETVGQIEIGYGLQVGDVDGDGQADVLLADKDQFVWYENGTWEKHVMVEGLTEKDNVCLAARDIDGDSKVEVAVGAQWNPGETSDTLKSGAVYYLVSPSDPREMWRPIKLHHEPTTHRMQWIKTGQQKYQLLVLPLHGRDNQSGQGKGVAFMSYQMHSGQVNQWDTTTIDQAMHQTHNFAVSDKGANPEVWVAGKEGVKHLYFDNGKWLSRKLPTLRKPAGEVSVGKLAGKNFLATIEPMHGDRLMLYRGDSLEKKTVLFDQLKQGHALATADLLDLGKDQIVVGWREPNAQGKTGIKLFVPLDEQGESWMHYWIDENGIACEDLKVADLDNDGDLDIVAAGRATHDLNIYWNRANEN